MEKIENLLKDFLFLLRINQILLRTKNSIDAQLQQLRGREVETDALLSQIDLGTSKEAFLAKINDPKNITSPELKQQLKKRNKKST